MLSGLPEGKGKFFSLHTVYSQSLYGGLICVSFSIISASAVLCQIVLSFHQHHSLFSEFSSGNCCEVFGVHGHFICHNWARVLLHASNELKQKKKNKQKQYVLINSFTTDLISMLCQNKNFDEKFW